MSKGDKFDEKLRELIPTLLVLPNIWSSASVDAEPRKCLESWQVFKITACVANHQLYGFHFLGRNVIESAGAVSSKILSFDPSTMKGITNSGRVYQLMGSPGYDGDADFVLDNWKQINQVKTKMATQEFLKGYGIPSIESVDAARNNAIACAHKVFCDADKANKWLNQVNPAFGCTPLSMLETVEGVNKVMKVLAAIATGGVV